MSRREGNVGAPPTGDRAMMTTLMEHVASTSNGDRVACEVTMRTSEYGTLRPVARVTLPRDTHRRRLGAALHLLAAAAEAGTPANERWCTCIDRSGDAVGYVYLDLVEGSDSEAARGLAHLRDVVGRLGWI